MSASVGSLCPQCVKAAKPDLATRARFWSASKPALVAYVLIGLNVAVFLGLGAFYDLGGMFSGRITDAHLLFGLNDFFLDGTPGVYQLSDGTREITEGNEWYRLVTSGFLHFGILHLAMNMYFLFILGNQMEPMLGRVRFLGLYLASLLGGSAGVVLIDQGSITAGASGAVFGLLGAYAVGVWQHGINVFSTQIGSLLLINLVLTFAISNISIGGHLGGLVAGGIAGYVMLAPGYKGYPDWLRTAMPVFVGLAAIGVAVVAVGA
ncbi:MAG: rhomboid family intramembrane serine protease [Actinomycetota bacterium]